MIRSIPTAVLRPHSAQEIPERFRAIDGTQSTPVLLGHPADDLGGNESDTAIKAFEEILGEGRPGTFVPIVWRRDDVTRAIVLGATGLCFSGSLLADHAMLSMAASAVSEVYLSTYGASDREISDALRCLLASSSGKASVVIIDDNPPSDGRLKTLEYLFGRFARIDSLAPSVGTIENDSVNWRKRTRRCWVASRKLEAGHVLGPDDLELRHSVNTDSGAIALEKLINRKLLRPLEQHEPITRADVPVVAWALIGVRMGSSRLPGKAMLDVAGMPALKHLIERLKSCPDLAQIVVCTTDRPEDQALVRAAEESGVRSFCGSQDDMLGRFLGAVGESPVDIAVRITGDDILVDPDYASYAIEGHRRTNAEHSTMKALPPGTEVELFDTDLLRLFATAAYGRENSEHLTYFATENPEVIRTQSIEPQPRHARSFRLTIDEADDYEAVNTLLQMLSDRGKALDYSVNDIVDVFDAHPELADINARITQLQTLSEVDVRIDWARWVADAIHDGQTCNEMAANE